MFALSCVHYQVFLEKAKDLGDRLLRAFDSPTGLPYNQINLQNGQGTGTSWAGGVRSRPALFVCGGVHLLVPDCG